MWTHLHLSKLIEIIVFDSDILLYQWQVAYEMITLKKILFEVQHESNSAGHRVANSTNITSPRLSYDTDYL